MSFKTAFFIIVLQGYAAVESGDVFRQTQYGIVKGITVDINENGMMEKYLGIPYSSPPIDAMRFSPPSKPTGWSGTLNATSFRPICPQLLDGTVAGEEDCLHLNIYCPSNNVSDPDESLAVLVWFHGTDSRRSFSNFYDGELAWYAEVIVVTINYRVGALGFLSTGDDQSPGNYGLMDQVAALNWVKENIHSFGGDRNRITVAGDSFGGVASQLLVLSTTIDAETDSQLFHRVISQSGSAFSDSVIDLHPAQQAESFFIGIGCSVLSNVLSLECARQKSYEDIVRTANPFHWRVVVDGNLLTGTPEELSANQANVARLRGRYQYLSGMNSFATPAIFQDIDNVRDAETFIHFINEYLKAEYVNSEEIADAVFLNYVDWNEGLPESPDLWKQMAVNATRDKGILAPVQEFASFAANDQGFGSRSYLYLFNLRPSEALAATKWAYPVEEQDDWVAGARSGEELPYLFGAPISIGNSTDLEIQISLQMMRHWGNFARTGDPNKGLLTTSHWPEFNGESSRYMLFGDEIYRQGEVSRNGSHLESDKVVLWTEEIPLYAQKDDGWVSSNNNAITNSSLAPPIVNTTSGTIKGVRFDRSGYIVDRFFRVPYAKAPEGDLRFRPPQPHPGWEGTLDCSDLSSAKQWLYICPQRNIRGNGHVGREDCLNLNIWVPGGVEAHKDSPLPVMLWIYGGGNQIGTNIGFTFFYDMEKITSQGSVIGITMNYRLNSLGFLTTDDEAAPANNGMLDQVAGMEWVQRNIANFGGDPSKVTIFGESAGGASVSLHMISPVSQPLFLRGISESGCIPSTWTYSMSGRSSAVRLAERLNCPTTTNAALVECLRRKPLKAVISEGTGVGWGAVVDGYFIPNDPKDIVNASRHKDYMVGHNSMEGHSTMSALFPRMNFDPDRPGSEMDREDVRRAARIYDFSAPEHVSEAVAYKYIDWNEPETAYLWPRLAIVAIATDWTFAMGSFTNALIRAESKGEGKTYVYVFGENSRRRRLPYWVESNHLREMVYTFGHPFEDSRLAQRFTDKDRALSRAMMTYWTNFAWSGNPNYPNKADIPIEWRDYELNNKFSILFNTSMYDQPENYVRYNYMGDRYHMWREILYGMRDLPLEECPAQPFAKTATGKTATSGKIPNSSTTRLHSQNGFVTCPEGDLIRTTTTGCVEGVEYLVNNSVVERYLGIPYADPPTGSLRFANPVARTPWNDVQPARSFSKICPQSPFVSSTMDEDCLYLNVYVPRLNSSDPLAVMAWIHGGGHQVGDGMGSYQGDILATYGGIIVVTLNYRLGSLGFLTTDDDSSPGNYGLFDQHFALSWVKSNIAYFGGDPEQITIVGQSAGAEDAHYHSLSPLTRSLGINRVILESAAGMPIDDMKQLENAQRLGEEASCPTSGTTSDLVSCLRNLDIQDLISAQANSLIGFYPTVDGVFLPDQPRMLSSDEDRIKLWTHLMGSNDGDGSAFWPIARDVTDEAGYHQAISGRFYSKYGWRTSSIDEQYARYEDASFFKDEQKIQKSLIEAFGDEMFIFPMHKLAIDYSQSGSDVYFYYYTYAPESQGITAPPPWIGARHSSEVPLVFGQVLTDPDEDELVQDLSLLIINYWSNFVKTGDPNSDGSGNQDAPAVSWPIYKDRQTDRNYIELNLGNQTVGKSNLRPTDDAFWNDYMPRQNVFCESDPAPDVTEPPQPNFDNPTVTTDRGTIRGKRVSNQLFDMHVFLGIPYAKPPVKELRFTKTAKLEDWPQPIEATSPKPPCMQLNMDNEVIGSEDCLYLDVFRRSAIIDGNTDLVPILIWVHGDDVTNRDASGGGFWSGGGSPGWNEDGRERIDPSYLANFGNLVIVRPNFRVGSFGFLATDNGQIEGNYGLQDLKAALEWTVELGAAFGGDTTKIALMGQGSGAALAELLGMLPSTSRHIARVISQSGSAFSPWAFYSNDCACSHSAEEIASSFGCGSTADLKLCLESVSAESIASIVPYRSPSSQSEPYNNWGTWRLRQDGILVPTRTLDDLYADSSFDLMSGTTSHEFYAALKAAFTENVSLAEAVDQTHRFLALSNSNDWPEELRDLLVYSYTPWQNLADEDSIDESIVMYYTDLLFQAASARGLDEKLSSGNGSIFQFILTKHSSAQLNETPSWLGGIHGDEIPYVFGFPITWPTSYSDADKKFSAKLMSYWSNFVWFGHPNTRGFPEWLSYQDSGTYMELDGSAGKWMVMKTSDYNIENAALWNEVIPVLLSDTNSRMMTNRNEMPIFANEECTKPVVSIGNGIGLDLSPEEADSTIYILFSMCLVLATVLIGLIVIRCVFFR